MYLRSGLYGSFPEVGEPSPLLLTSVVVALLNIPGFIERLCKLATRKVSEATGNSNILQELEEWYAWLDNALVLDALMQMTTEEHSSTGDVCILPECLAVRIQRRGFFARA